MHSLTQLPPTPVAGATPATDSVARYLLDELAALGVRQVFGVPGDYSFPLVDAVLAHGSLRWIGAAGELGAAYMADGAGRVTGFSALCTTFGVGELGALPGLAGSCAERVPVVHLVGLPPTKVLQRGLLVHHAMGETDLRVFSRMSAEAFGASAILTVENAKSEIDRVLTFTRERSLPGYLGIPADVALAPLVCAGGQTVVHHSAPPREQLGCWAGTMTASLAVSDPAALAEAVATIEQRLAGARSACALIGAIVPRLGLRRQALRFLEKYQLPFCTMWMDKSALPESHPLFCGMYAGAWGSDEVRAFVESRDVVVNLGALMTDLNTAAYTARLDPARVLAANMTKVRVGAAEYSGVRLSDLLGGLAESAAPARGVAFDRPALSLGAGPVAGSGRDVIDAAAFFPRCQAMLRRGDLVFVEAGTITIGLLPVLMPADCEFMSQSHWSAIGWAAPAAIGASLAEPERRVICFTGEGALQCTATELGAAARSGAKPVIIVVNNDGYLTERLLCNDPQASYNDVPPWDYPQVARSLGCDDWWIGRATNCGELDQALAELTAATTGPQRRGAFLEVVMPRMALPAMAAKIRAGKPGR